MTENSAPASRPGRFSRGGPGHRLTIEEDDLGSEETRALVRLHLQAMHDSSPPGTCFALDISGLSGPGITLWTARLDGRVAAMGALRELGDGTGELKSMRTHPDYLRRGLAAAMLDHIIAVARDRGLVRLSLETGSGPAFDAALALYARRGFVEGPPFADYRPSPFNRFWHLDLD